MCKYLHKIRTSREYESMDQGSTAWSQIHRGRDFSQPTNGSGISSGS